MYMNVYVDIQERPSKTAWDESRDPREHRVYLNFRKRRKTPEFLVLRAIPLLPRGASSLLSADGATAGILLERV